MGFDISLGLGLSFRNQSSENCSIKIDVHRQIESQKKNEEDPCTKPAYPSLTLGRSLDDEENNQLAAAKTESRDASSPISMVSSFSNSSSMIKRERDQFTCSEEFEPEVDKIPSSSGAVDFHENGNPRKKLRLTKQQSALLEDSFKEHSTLNPKQKQELAKKLNLRTRQVEVWFQNRRARTKLKQTEVDCEVLKKCYEKLTEENKRLQTELKELKSMKTAAPEPFYVQLPVASLTVCRSCKRICSGSGGEGNNGSSTTSTTALLIGSKPHHHFYSKNNYTLTHPSAAC